MPGDAAGLVDVFPEGGEEGAAHGVVVGERGGFQGVVVEVVELEGLEGTVLQELPGSPADGVIILAAVPATLAAHPDHSAIGSDGARAQERGKEVESVDV